MTERNREWTEIAVIAAVSFVLYQLNMFILFLIPVQLLYARRGERAVEYGALVLFVATAVAALVRLGGVEDSSLRNALLVLELAIPSSLLGGIVLIDIHWPAGIRLRRSGKLGVCTVAVGLLSIPVIVAASKDDGLTRFFFAQIEAFKQSFQLVADGDATFSAYAFSGILADPEKLARMVTELLLRNYLFGYFLLIAASVWLGDYAAAKTTGGDHRRLSSFRLPDRAIWLFLAGWALVLLDMGLGIGVARYVGWNLGMIMLLLYGLQGAGIIRHWFIARGVSPWLRMAVSIGLVLFLFLPGVNMLVMILVPGLGISETWIHYRKSLKE